MASPDELRHVGSPTPGATAGPATGAHQLGPHVVGQRVVVRRLVPGETGPTGGPAFTDLLGVAEEWEPDLVVRGEDGVRTVVPRSLIVSGKPVPPRPSPLLRVPAATAQRRIRAMWAGETAELGEWLLQVTPPFGGRVRRRANSVLAYGDPGRPVAEAATAATAWLRERDRSPEAAVEVGSRTEAALRDLGWSEPADFAGHAVAVRLASTSRVRRALRALPRPAAAPPGAEVSLTVAADPGVDRVRAVLPAAGDLEVAGVGLAGGALEVAGDWACLHDLRTDPAHRRRGHAIAVVDALVDAAAERGATTLALHVLTTNAAASALYERLGFVTHHTTTYLAPPA
ncbi:GNAT family N-acetyltransferase [Nocardioides zeae]|uniref:GNAT family N-acetyltransferase n=1 Tax=Nocardioides imazamoxiresistens TaxID=3231893 RepID=A0ABU3PZ25_9ACTN|nr:GNAT family N-acetyltransferase [Nocardioides zeae]MDT9594057.1 GNAT family N-acetyltransferase [Nocardioides zeae]